MQRRPVITQKMDRAEWPNACSELGPVSYPAHIRMYSSEAQGQVHAFLPRESMGAAGREVEGGGKREVRELRGEGLNSS